MKATLWSRVQEIVSQAADLPADARLRWVETNCAGDVVLQRQVEEMLQAYGPANDFFEQVIHGAASFAAALHEIVPGDRLGPYSITETLGLGGMGTVYRAQRVDDQFQQDVAIKVVRTTLGANEELFARFRAERQILANISHPNIARLLDGGITENGLPFLVMEFINGRTLDKYLAEVQPSLPARLELFSQLCAAIQCAHQNLVVHRDLKPSNVIVGQDSVPHLLDFGIAKLLRSAELAHEVYQTRASDRIMTPEYASPEQLRGEAITTATDVYGLGVLLYEIVAGRRPFDLSGLSPGESERVVYETQPVRTSTLGLAPSRFSQRRTTDLDRITQKAMHRDPSRRYASASALAADVQRYLDGFPVTARAGSFRYRSGRFLARHRVASVATVLVSIAIVGLSVALALQALHARREAQAAEAVSDFLSSLFTGARPDKTQGRSISARDLLDAGTAQLRADHRQSRAIRARLLTTLGTVYYTWGVLDRADNLLTEAKDLWTQEQKQGREGLTDTANVLGMIAQDRGDFQRAEQEDETVLREVVLTKGRVSEEAAVALSNLGNLAWTEGKFDEAERYTLESIEIDAHLKGPESQETLTAKNNLGTIYADRGEYSRAGDLAREVLQERLHLLGPNNPEVAFSMNNLAFVLDSTGRLREAERLKQQTVELRRKVYGKQHPDIAQALVSLGWTERELEHFGRAQSLTLQGVEMAGITIGEESLDTAFDEDAMGLVFLDMGQPVEARPWVEKALRTRLSKPQPPRMTVAQSYEHLGRVDLLQGHAELALTEINRALAMKRAFYGKDNDAVAQTLVHRAEVLAALKRLPEALENVERALEVQHATFGFASHQYSVKALAVQANVLEQVGRSAEGKKLLAQSTQMQKALQAQLP